jgi:N-acetylneuraminate synthase/pseudaminic acid synthase
MNAGAFIVAEMSANHCGRLDVAKRVIAEAKACGADAVKVQTYTADTMTLDCKADCFKVHGSGQWDGQYLYDLYKDAGLPWEWHAELKSYADSLGIEFFSTPYDRTAVDFLEKLGVARYKIASFEAVDIPLIRHAAAKGKPMIISTGVCSPEEMQDAVDACHAEGNNDVTLLKCTSAYPAAPESMNLATVADMVSRFAPQGVKVGLSDHTMTTEAAVVAVSLGATMVERHFTVDRSLGGADAAFSATPDEFRQMVESVRLAERLLGHVDYAINPVARDFVRSLFVCEDMKEGDVFTEKNLRSIRPGSGCAPKMLPALLGKRADRDLSRGTPMMEEYAI